jgi:hypothetical protein
MYFTARPAAAVATPATVPYFLLLVSGTLVIYPHAVSNVLPARF